MEIEVEAPPQVAAVAELELMPPPVQVEKLLAALQKSATNARLLGA